ncbi:hypothetical protein K438DRAFT_1677051 [Mycena galopus ATCC 62051]|nr:hypothetical protein K438DRAFT_1677051 [Mycena galopus ATCC 62051]
MAASPPTPQALLGPYYFGVILNTFLYGILVMQTMTYYPAFKNDKLWLRLFVLYLFVVETLNTGICVAMIYQPLVGQFGTSSPTFLFPSRASIHSFPWVEFRPGSSPVLPAQPCLEVAISVPVQFFYAWRISVMMRNYFVPAFIGVTSLTAMGKFICLLGAIWTAIIVYQVKNYANKPKVNTTALVWSCCSAASDLIVTVSLFWSLTRRKTGIKRTDDILDTIARHSIQTGLLTVICSILDVSLFVALPNSTLSFFFDFGLPKLYSNSLVSTLNARHGGMDGGIIELETPSIVFTASTRTGQTPTTFGSNSIVAWARPTTHKLPADDDDLLALDMDDGSLQDPK